MQPLRISLVLAAALLLGACSSPSASTRNHLSDSPLPIPAHLAPADAQAVALQWLAAQGESVDASNLTWHAFIPSERGCRLTATASHGHDETGAAIVGTYILDIENGAVAAAWGPRVVGGGCSCLYPVVSRMK